MRYLVGLLLAISLLAGCNSEALTTASVVVDGKEVRGAGLLMGNNGFQVGLQSLARALGGEVQEVDETTVVLALGGKRILLAQSEMDIPHDAYVEIVVTRVDHAIYLTGPEVTRVLQVVYPGARAYRKGSTVYIDTTPAN